MKKFLNSGVGKFLSGILLIGMVLGVGTFIVSLFNNTDVVEDYEEINVKFEIGGLDELGSYLDTEGSIYTKEIIEVTDLFVEIEFDTNVSYQLFFYDEDGELIRSTDILTKNSSYTADENDVLRVRDVVTPLNDESINFLEVYGYANQLTFKTSVQQPTIEETPQE